MTKIEITQEIKKYASAIINDCDDIISYGRNYFSVQFKIDYQNADGDISNYYPDFFVKKV